MLGENGIYMQKTETRFLSSVIKSTHSHVDSHVRTKTIKLWRNALGYWNGYQYFKGDSKITGSRRKKKMIIRNKKLHIAKINNHKIKPK